MGYELKEYHHDIKKEDLIKDLCQVSKKLNEKYISKSLYAKFGKYSVMPYRRIFGSWENALIEAGLKSKRDNNEFNKIDDKAIISDIKRVALELDKQSITTQDYKDYGNYSIQTVLKRFCSWRNVCNLAKLKPTNYKIVSDEDLFNEIIRLWELKGSQPTTTDIRQQKSIYSLNTYARHFGGFRNALSQFIKYVNADEKTISNYIRNNNKNIANKGKEKVLIDEKQSIKHKTPREINLRLRYKVLLRDNFKCRICGASPSNDSSIKLHIDHIIPWSKGGETTIENLQTLCSKCNLGKSDIS